MKNEPYAIGDLTSVLIGAEIKLNSIPSGVQRVIRRSRSVRVLIIILMLFAVTYGGIGVLRLALHTESPLMVVSSGSMIPTLNIGDIIIVQGVDPRLVTVNQIVIFHSPYDYPIAIVHRIIKVDQNDHMLYFETKGDNNPGPDGWRVPASNLIGEYVARIPYLGLVSLALKGPLGVTVIITLAALIIVLEYRHS